MKMLKVGDKVKIRKKEECIKADQKYVYEKMPGFIDSMYRYCGKSFSITDVFLNVRGIPVYRLDDADYIWSAHYFKSTKILKIL